MHKRFCSFVFLFFILKLFCETRLPFLWLDGLVGLVSWSPCLPWAWEASVCVIKMFDWWPVLLVCENILTCFDLLKSKLFGNQNPAQRTLPPSPLSEPWTQISLFRTVQNPLTNPNQRRSHESPTYLMYVWDPVDSIPTWPHPCPCSRWWLWHRFFAEQRKHWGWLWVWRVVMVVDKDVQAMTLVGYGSEHAEACSVQPWWRTHRAATWYFFPPCIPVINVCHQFQTAAPACQAPKSWCLVQANHAFAFSRPGWRLPPQDAGQTICRQLPGRLLSMRMKPT